MDKGRTPDLRCQQLARLELQTNRKEKQGDANVGEVKQDGADLKIELV